MSNIKIFSYNEQEIEFNLTQKTIMVNATEMAKIYDKQVIAFLRNDDAKNFISECLKSENSHFLGIEKESDLYISKQRSGTWMHRILALKFAAWLNPSFELWVYSTIDEILFGRMAQRTQILKKKTLLEIEIETIEREWRQGDKFKRVLTLQNEVNRLNRQAKLQDREYVAEQMPLWSEEDWKEM